MDHRHYLRNPDAVRIALSQTLSLTGALIYLQFLYGLTRLYALIWDFHPAWPPFRHARKRTEDRIVGICLCIAPTSACRAVLAARQYNEARIGSPRVVSGSYFMHAPSGVAPPAPRLPQCYPESSVERAAAYYSNPNVYLIDGSSSLNDAHAQYGFLVTDSTGKKTVAGDTVANSPAVSVPQERQKQQQQPPPQPSPQQQPGHQETKSSAASHHQTEQVSDPLPRPSLQGSGSALAHCRTDPGPIPCSAQEPDGLSVRRLKRGSKYRSAESFPGRFPVSDGLAYSSLATASYAFRGKSATSVRPFSDM